MCCDGLRQQLLVVLACLACLTSPLCIAQSLAVGNSEKPGESRITTVVPGTGQGVVKLVNQLNKLVYVQKVTDLTSLPVTLRELMLIKVSE